MNNETEFFKNGGTNSLSWTANQNNFNMKSWLYKHVEATQDIVVSKPLASLLSE